jgi:hypothetical protein
MYYMTSTLCQWIFKDFVGRRGWRLHVDGKPASIERTLPPEGTLDVPSGTQADAGR